MKKFSREEIEKKVNDIIVDELGVSNDEVKPDALMEDDLYADSLDAVEITLELEREFGITISDEDMDGLTHCKVSDIYDLVNRLSK